MAGSRYRKKPVEVRAIQWTGDNLDEVKQFVAEISQSDGDLKRSGDPGTLLLWCDPARQWVDVYLDGWIAAELDGLYSWTPEGFEAVYEPAHDPPPEPRGGDMSRPRRIQISRRKGYRKPEGAVVVARPTKWGNPFKVGEVVPPEAYGYLVGPFRPDLLEALRGLTSVRIQRQEQAVEAYGWWVIEQPALMLAIPGELAGHDLACWCPLDQPCHASVLLELANP